MGEIGKFVLLGILLIVIGILGLVVRHFQARCQTLEHAQREFRHQREAVVDMLNRIGQRIHASHEVDDALGIIAEYLVETTHAESGVIYLLDADGKALRPRATVGSPPNLCPLPLTASGTGANGEPRTPEMNVRGGSVAMGEGIIGFVAQRGEPVLISSAAGDPRIPRPANAEEPAIRSLVAAPLRVRQRTVGVCVLVNRQDRATFDDQDLGLLQQLATQAALTVDVVRLYDHEQEQRRIEHELAVARQFQNMLLPREFPEPDGYDIWAFNNPALEVGGDYFDFIWVEKPLYLGIVVVDVSGKGIPGALVMALVRTTLRLAAPACLSPREVLRKVNQRIREDIAENVFITMTYAILDTRNRRLLFVRAGHEPLILLGDDANSRPATIQPSGIALGLVGDEVFDVLEERQVELSPGDTAMFYSDGAVEALNAANEEFGPERFVNGMQRRHTASAREQIEGVLQEIEEYTGGIPQQDDVTLLAVKALAGAQLPPKRGETHAGQPRKAL
jgi:serine phosphatase RsbU (regulator of sigma subunit)